MKLRLRSMRELKNIAGKRVLLRVDFNVPLTRDMQVSSEEDYRIRQSLPTIKYLLERKARVIILAHLGRPEGRVVELLRLDPIAVRLAQLLRRDVYKCDQLVGAVADKAVADLQLGDLLVLENVRFDRREERADTALAKKLASYGDIYINDAFGVDHRDQASVSTIQRYLPSYAGLLLEDELTRLSSVRDAPRHPLVVIIGGSKISTKLSLIKSFLPRADHILLGGALANTVLRAQGISVGQSLVEPGMIAAIRRIKLTNTQLHVPVDGVIAKSYHSPRGRRDALGDIRPSEVIVDIGPETLELYAQIIRAARQIVWNGPMGLIETPSFAWGTRELAKAIARSKAESIVGGGETVQMIRRLRMERKFNFLSTGGGAMLEFLEGKKLPGIQKLIKK